MKKLKTDKQKRRLVLNKLKRDLDSVAASMVFKPSDGESVNKTIRYLSKVVKLVKDSGDIEEFKFISSEVKKNELSTSLCLKFPKIDEFTILNITITNQTYDHTKSK
jgi:hypothetical protein